jgi:hypothetical protein
VTSGRVVGVLRWWLIWTPDLSDETHDSLSLAQRVHTTFGVLYLLHLSLSLQQSGLHMLLKTLVADV